MLHNPLRPRRVEFFSKNCFALKRLFLCFASEQRGEKRREARLRWPVFQCPATNRAGQLHNDDSASLMDSSSLRLPCNLMASMVAKQQQQQLPLLRSKVNPNEFRWLLVDAEASCNSFRLPLERERARAREKESFRLARKMPHFYGHLSVFFISLELQQS